MNSGLQVSIEIDRGVRSGDKCKRLTYWIDLNSGGSSWEMNVTVSGV